MTGINKKVGVPKAGMKKSTLNTKSMSQSKVPNLPPMSMKPPKPPKSY